MPKNNSEIPPFDVEPSDEERRRIARFVLHERLNDIPTATDAVDRAAALCFPKITDYMRAVTAGHSEPVFDPNDPKINDAYFIDNKMTNKHMYDK